MLRKIKLVNFQAHSELVLDFEKGINTIVGDSDVGKSACVRALRWVLFNRPSGVSFIKHGQKEARVSIWVGDVRITRRRSKSKNDYLVTKNGQTSKFTAFGNDVPPAVLAEFPVNDMNFQRQFDAPLWFSEGGGNVSKQLNRIVNLSSLDDSAAYIASHVRSSKDALESSKQRCKQLKSDLQDLECVDEIFTDLHKVESVRAASREAEASISELEELLHDCAELKRASKFQGLGELILLHSEMGKTVARYNEADRSTSALILLCSDAKEAKDTMDACATQLQELEQHLHKETKGRCPVCGGIFNET